MQEITRDSNGWPDGAITEHLWRWPCLPSPISVCIKPWLILHYFFCFRSATLAQLGDWTKLSSKQRPLGHMHGWLQRWSWVSSAIERSTMAMNGRDCDISTHDAMRFTVVMLKCDWYCLFSGSRSNSLNSCKFPGRFPYGLETRLSQSWKGSRMRLVYLREEIKVCVLC